MAGSSPRSSRRKLANGLFVAACGACTGIALTAWWLILVVAGEGASAG